MLSETVELRGHIIDSLILPKVLDKILTSGAHFKILEIKIGQQRADQSFARIEVSAPTEEMLSGLLLRLVQHGAEVTKRANVQLAPAPADGVFPHDFYVTTNQQTFVRIGGHEIEVRPATMDSAIAVSGKVARAVKFFDVRHGDQIVVGRDGVRVVPVQRSTSHTDLFQFINASIGPDQDKSAIIRELAVEFKKTRGGKGKVAVVAGPAVVRSGAGEHLQRLIQRGFIDRLFAGNAFAIYDVERALFGTAAGTSPERALSAGGNENIVRATNIIRECGGIAPAVAKKVLSSGLMYTCVKKKVDVILTGSIRDDGPIPGVISDIVEAQKIMRDKLVDITHVLILGTMQHAMAIATMLEPTVKSVCVDIDPWAVERMIEHQPFQSLGLVTDVEPFLRELAEAMASDGNSDGKSDSVPAKSTR